MKRTPPSYTGLQVCIHVLMCSCAPSDESPAIPEDRADHTDTRMAFQMVCKIQYKLYGICLALLTYQPIPHPSPPPPCSKLHFHAYCRQHEGMGTIVRGAKITVASLPYIDHSFSLPLVCGQGSLPQEAHPLRLTRGYPHHRPRRTQALLKVKRENGTPKSWSSCNKLSTTTRW